MTWKSTTHTLIHPINLSGQTYDKVTLREPSVDALEAIEELGIEQGEKMTTRIMRGVIEALCDLPKEAVGKMHRDDFLAVGNIATPLLMPSGESAE